MPDGDIFCWFSSSSVTCRVFGKVEARIYKESFEWFGGCYVVSSLEMHILPLGDYNALFPRRVIIPAIFIAVSCIDGCNSLFCRGCAIPHSQTSLKCPQITSKNISQDSQVCRSGNVLIHWPNSLHSCQRALAIYKSSSKNNYRYNRLHIVYFLCYLMAW